MRYNGRVNSNVPSPGFGRTTVVAAAFVLLSLVGVSSASAQSSSKPALTVGAELQAGTFFYMPNVSLLITTSLPILGTNIAIVPTVGATYLFLPMTGLSGNWYVPLGAELSFPEEKLAVFARNLVAIASPFGEGGVTFGAKAFVPFATVGKSSFGLTVEAGAAVFWNAGTPTQPLFLLDFAPALRYAYQVKTFS